MDKRDRAQKIKRDKRNKDVMRCHDHPKKSENKPVNATAPKPQAGSTKDLKSDVKTTLNQGPMEETKEVPLNQFANLKRETDEINQLNIKTFSKRQVTSNWSKYETPLLPEDDEVISKGADFESLLGAPISEGGHFKFKSEQMWSQNPLQFSDIFSLDVKHLARSVSRIPFYEQLGLSKELFSKDEVEQMDKEAKQNSDLYQTSCNGPIVTNFYEVLKSSLVDTPIQNPTDKEFDIKSESVGKELKESTENIGIRESLVVNQMDNVQHVQRSHHSTELDSLFETQDILRPQKAEKDMNLNISKQDEKNMTLAKDTNSSSVLQVPSSQTSVESRPTCNDSLENKDVPKNSPSENREIPVNNITHEINPPTSDLTVKQNTNAIEDDDELDFLLTLKHPVSGPTHGAKSHSKPVPVDDILSDDLGALSMSSTTETKEELEDWLNTMLAD